MGVVSGDVCRKTQIEYVGYLPAFWHTGSHPQFLHIENPPKGYEFKQTEINKAGIKECSSKQRLFLSIVKGIRSFYVAHASFKLMAASIRNGAKIKDVIRFIKSQGRGGIKTQLQVPVSEKMLFLPSYNYILGQAPWMIEIEDSTTLFLPFISNGETYTTSIRESAYYPVVKALLESEQCRTILCHVKSTADSLPVLFQNQRLKEKISYIPLGVDRMRQTGKREREEGDDTFTILFTSSWGQDPKCFYTRGGIDLLEAFDRLSRKYPHIRLILKTRLPADLAPKYREMIRKNWNIKVIEQFVSNEEMHEITRNSDVFVLPAARLHVVSILKSMAYGIPVVVSDGWGIEEYVQDGYNGLVVKGRYSKCSWMDGQTGELKEDYRSLKDPDTHFVHGLVEALSTLVENQEVRDKLVENALRDVETKYSLDTWNEQLKEVFDRVIPSDAERMGVFRRLEKRIMHRMENQIRGKRIAIFGACKLGEEYLQKIVGQGEAVPFFIDNFPPESGQFMDRPVYKPNYLIEEGEDQVDVVLLASMARADQMRHQLKELKFKKLIVEKLI